MNIDQLTYIVEIAKTNSLSTAARNLFVSVPALSQAISNLESEFDVELFERSRNGTFPTAEGLALIQKAAIILEQIHAFKEEARSYSNTMSGELRIATIPGPMYLLVKTLAGFKRDFPNVRIEISEKSSQEIMSDIRQHKVDLGLIVLYEDLRSSIDEFEFTKVMDTKLVCFLNRNNRLSLQKSVSIEDFQRYPLVLYKEDYLGWFIEKFGRQYGHVDLLFTTNNSAAIRGALREEMAISVGVDYTFLKGSEYLSNDPELIIMDMDVPINRPVPLGWAMHHNAAKSRILKLFINRLKLQLMQDES
ncbi:LysR family transcriptional regulator [Paenibacillus sp. PR3]|uniref:LysR family transcriptional regulator n=1 Tax=Paenibacillus terricola TaxID=2763503 RepID=A0ABR8N0A4_9BACL|nr:LysR family transcriptional regulator [Paenibacillus terricola]MBD3921623.1 LysR family transcriptional regulator [Paenibacillus terricola]